MAYKTITDEFRASLATDLYNKLQTGGSMKFGSGGWNEAEQRPETPDPAQTDLNTPLITKEIVGLEQPDAYSVKATGRLLEGDLVGVGVSEAGLFSGSMMVGVKNFSEKIKDSDEFYDVSISILF